MDRAVKFYTETLGGKVLMRDTGEMKDMWASIKLAGSEFWLITPDKQEKRELSYSVFAVKDITTAVRDLKAKGVKFSRAERMSKETKVEGPIARDAGMGASAFFKDSEGNLLMLFEMMQA
jgi:predicted enzyme related to lactoylglutathione lyase